MTGSTSTQCILCDIVRGDAPASFVHRDDVVSAFLDIRPVTPGHTLVIPNRHEPLIGDVAEDVRDRVFRLGVELGGAVLRADLGAEGFDLFLADGEAAGQEVPHAHLHVLPRFRGDGFAIDAAAWREPPPLRAELDHQADAIRSALSELASRE